MLVGLGTGCLYRMEVSEYDRIKLYAEWGVPVIELTFKYADDLSVLDPSLLLDALKPFSRVSLHAPMKGVYTKGSDTYAAVKQLHESIGFDGIVVHPHQVEDFSWLASTGLPWLVENLDATRDAGSSPEWFTPLVEDTDLRFCLDLQHCYQDDTSLQNARRYVQLFGDRLGQIHISGFGPEGHSTLHDRSEQHGMLAIAKQCDVPIIFESATDDPESLRRELSLF